ncbi:hypothetical protein AVEN_89626-1 [Araneus ventricosus]|uniref:Uncharacterized protein n=1 Tax=Araneus ventricosus TaxID=182803 RepID=A0A4Y2ND74_ARAVE|nr:hypothetical protein AVEN_89626-1 [Araneus ventricosus]
MAGLASPRRSLLTLNPLDESVGVGYVYETQKMRQIEEEFSDQVQEILKESMTKAFAMDVHYSPEQFELYRVNICKQKDEERKKIFNEMVVTGSEKCMEICMNPFSELCKELDDILKKFGVYAKEITESEECRKNEEMIKKPGGHTIFG